MKLKFLGIGSAYNTKWYNSNAYFYCNNNLFLLDCGESTFARVKEKGILDGMLGNCYVFLTHLHADHAGSLPSLCSFFSGKLNKKVRVIYPGQEVDDYLRLAGIPCNDYIHVTDFNALPAGIHAQSLMTEHIPGYPSYGWILSDENETIYFSGDSKTILPNVVSKLLDKSLTMVYHDVEYNAEEKADGCHLQYQMLLRTIPPEVRNRFCCMHMNCDYRHRAVADGFLVAQTDDIE